METLLKYLFIFFIVFLILYWVFLKKNSFSKIINSANLLEKYDDIINLNDIRIFILIRVCYRPSYFYKCFNSILNQSFNNIHLIISYDNDKCLEYLIKYKNNYKNIKLIKVKEDKSKPCFYNLYCNTLLKLVPKKENNWIMFLDDDDKLLNNKAIETITKKIESTNDFIFWKFMYDNGRIIGPNNYNEIQLGNCANCTYLINSMYKDYSKYKIYQNGDFEFIKKLKENKNLNYKFINKQLTGTIKGSNYGKTEKYSTL